MSHVTKLGLSISNLSALAAACSDLGVEFAENQKQFRTYGGQLNKCDHAIRVPGSKDAYEIGLVKNNEGAYELKWDDFAGGKGLVSKVGENGNLLKQGYQLHHAQQHFQKKGFRTSLTQAAENGHRQVQVWR